jgi:hypothetical protein
MKTIKVGDIFTQKIEHSFKLGDESTVVYRLLAYCPKAKDCYKQIQLERVSVDGQHPEKFGYSKYMLNELPWLTVRGFIIED